MSGCGGLRHRPFISPKETRKLFEEASPREITRSVRFADAHSGSTRRRIMPEPSSSSPSSSSSIKVLATTHALVFLAGVVAGRSLNADELAAYRAAQYEDRGRQLKLAAAKVALGVAACSIAMIGLRVKRASS